MPSSYHRSRLLLFSVLGLFAATAGAQSFRVQCPTSTITHPAAPDTEPPYSAPTYTGTSTSYTVGKTGPVNLSLIHI